MGKRRLIVRRDARTDVNRIAVYIGERNLDAGLRFLDAADLAFKFLSENPRIGSRRLSRNPRLENLRSWPIRNFDNYIVFYMAHDQGGIEIVRVLHGAQTLIAS